MIIYETWPFDQVNNNKCDVLLFPIQIFLHREGKEHVWTCCMFILSFTFGVNNWKVFFYTMKRETSYYIYSHTKLFYAQWVIVVYTSCQYENKNDLHSLKTFLLICLMLKLSTLLKLRICNIHVCNQNYCTEINIFSGICLCVCVCVCVLSFLWITFHQINGVHPLSRVKDLTEVKTAKDTADIAGEHMFKIYCIKINLKWF